MITDIRLRGFRGIRKGEITDFRKFNVFVGANNSGKSTLLEALYLAATAADLASLIVQHDAQAIPYKVRLPEEDVLGRSPTKHVAERHNFEVGQPGLGIWSQGSIRAHLKRADVPLPDFDLMREPSGFTTGEESLITLFALDVLAEEAETVDLARKLINAEGASGRVMYCWHPQLVYYTQGAAAWSIQGKMPKANHTLLSDILTLRQHLPVDFYRRALASVPGWTQTLAQHFGAIFGLDKSSFIVQFVPAESGVQGWIAMQARPALPIDAFGDGARLAFKLLAPLVALAQMASEDAPGLLLWEEPEVFQNPATLGRLLTEVVRLVERKPIQVFMTTHSLEAVAYLTDMLQKQRIAEQDVRLFRVNLRDGKLTSTWFDAGNLTSWLESGLDPRVWDEFVSPLQFHLQEGE